MDGPSLAGRRRGLQKQNSTTTEESALNLIAREAEARLAAKRAARAEARSIRMKELEKAQKEADALADREYAETGDETTAPKSRRVSQGITLNTVSRLTSGLLPDEDRDILLESTHVSEAQISQLKDDVKDLDAKYRQAMVSIAQYDNDRQALQYQVECLKDQIEDMNEQEVNLKDELTHKTREYNKLSREHQNTLKEVDQLRVIVHERERILEEHGINIDGTLIDRKEETESPAAAMPATLLINHSEGDLDAISNGFPNSERQELIDEINTLKSKLDELRLNQSASNRSERNSLDELKRELSRQSLELKSTNSRLETENAQLEAQAQRLDQQVKRYKSQADNAENVEDALIAEKRKLARELRQAQEKIMEVETERDSLRKRYDKLKKR